jgi:hypothetical protein
MLEIFKQAFGARAKSVELRAVPEVQRPPAMDRMVNDTASDAVTGIPVDGNSSDTNASAMEDLPRAHERRVLRNGQIISNIMQEGLRSAADLIASGQEVFTSDDGVSKHKRINGRVIRDEAEIDHALTGEEFVSIFPVLSERMGEGVGVYAEIPESEAQDRFRNSMLVVIPSDALTVECLGKVGDAHISHPISSELFGTVIVPQQIYDEAPPGVFDGASVVPVGDISMEFTDDNEFTVPDYKQALTDLIQDSDKTLFVHGVRLLTAADAQKTIVGERETISIKSSPDEGNTSLESPIPMDPTDGAVGLDAVQVKELTTDESGAFTLGGDGIDDQSGRADGHSQSQDFDPGQDGDASHETEVIFVTEAGLSPVFEADLTNEQSWDRDDYDEGRE